MQSDDFLAQLPKVDAPPAQPNGMKPPKRKKPAKKPTTKRVRASGKKKPRNSKKVARRTSTPAPAVERKARTIKVDLGTLQGALKGLDKRSVSKVHQVLGALTGTSKKMRGRVLAAVWQIVS